MNRLSKTNGDSVTAEVRRTDSSTPDGRAIPTSVRLVHVHKPRRTVRWHVSRASEKAVQQPRSSSSK